MKNSSAKIAVACSCAVILVSPLCVSAKTTSGALGGVTTKLFGYDSVAIIANNPLYGLTKVVDNVKGYFGSEKLADQLAAEADRLNRSAAELIRAYQVAPKNSKLLLKALTEYQGSVYRFSIVLGKIDAANDAASAATVDLANIFESHIRLIDELSNWKYLNNSHLALIRDISDRFYGAAATTLANVLPNETFISQLDGAVEDASAVDQVRSAEVLDILARAAAHNNNDELAKHLLAGRTNLLVDVAKHNADEVANQIAQYAGSDAERLQTVVFLLNTDSLRNNQQLTDLRNQLLIRMF